MEELELTYLYCNRYKDATIQLVRNYSRIDDNQSKNQRNYPYSTRSDLEVPFDNFKEKHKFFFTVNKELIDKERTIFSFNGDSNFYNTNFRYFKALNTDKDEQIKKHYKNPFASMYITVVKHSIYKKGDKLYVSKYDMSKTREMNRKYFLKRFDKHTVTFHLKTGNFTIRKEKKTGSTHFTTFRQNNFKLLYTTLREIFSYEQKYNKTLRDDMFEVLKRELNLEFETYGELSNAYMTNFIEKRKIKVPEEYKALLMHHYPTEKFLKKNDRKLVVAITDRLGLKSKLTTKMINMNPDKISISALFKFRVFFGDDFYKYLAQIKPEHFSTVEIGFRRQFIRPDLIGKSFKIDKKEKQAMLAYINDTLDQNLHRGIEEIFRSIEDHFRMMIELKEYFPDLRFTSRTHDTFQQEHSRLSKLLRKIKKETTIEFIFLPETIQKIEKEIISFIDEKDGKTIVLKPVILKTEDEYHDEGDYMHHCVGGYVNHDRSIIISLRTEDGKDRVTNEYRIENGNCVQSQHFCNKRPPEHFEHGLEILGERVRSLARMSTLGWIEKKRVPVKINGVEVGLKKNDSPNARDLENPFAEPETDLFEIENDNAIAMF